MKLLVELLVGAFSGFSVNPRKHMVGATGFEPVTSTV